MTSPTAREHGEDWSDDIGASVIVKLGDETIVKGKLESTGQQPWDLNITLEDGSSLHRGGGDTEVVVRILESTDVGSV